MIHTPELNSLVFFVAQLGKMDDDVAQTHLVIVQHVSLTMTGFLFDLDLPVFTPAKD